MKKKYTIRELDCANCAAKMEERIRKINGVKNASVSFMTCKLTLEADEQEFERILNEAQKAVSSVDPACVIV